MSELLQSLNLLVGATLHMDLMSGETRRTYPVTLIGYFPGNSILVTMPQQGIHDLSVGVGDKFVVRFAEGDTTIAFQTSVINICSSPYPYLHLGYPEGVQGVMLRSATRYSTNKPIMLLAMLDGDSKEPISVTMSDVSITGACLLAEKDLGETGDTFDIDMEIKGQGAIVLSCVIRYVNEGESGGSRHGVEFTHLDHKALLFLGKFIQDSVNHQRCLPS